MRLTVKALGWIIAFLWIVTLILPISVALSMLRLADGRNLGVQEPTFTFTDGNVSLTMPIYVNNTGFYDISEANVKIKIFKANITLATVSKTLPDIPAGRTVNTSCVFTANIRDIFQKAPILLTEDTSLDVNAMLHFRVAYTIAFNIANNFSTLWGAPFHNLTIHDIAYNNTRHVLSFYMGFNNHAAFSLNSPLTIELLNSSNETIGMASIGLDVPSGDSFQELVEVAVNPLGMTNEILIRLFFADLKIFEKKAWL